ncbi:type II toxin-antitoxin system VapC family toxin [Kibdelosporangium persicum]|uniref:Nucleic acid-binding protein, contains PIN domain n=1 Tax=Kibdelosporangium persicum TaxID=2698649 RepID=A0ABX2FDD3_9PSEU|nr:type II toxin-antitoxin system VapC family toxin [Kibdelosporangium persicum]NRN69134.1 putative nucleic acid-binding protein, contains PIN domain [Kibdelosporangium persicum]
MTTFADSSAVVKIYADEPGHELVRARPVLVVSQVARAEVPAALWRKQRDGMFEQVEAEILVAAFESDYYGTPGHPLRFVVVDLNPVVLEAAARLTRRHGLRTLDAIQLASAVLAAEADPDITEFAAWDKHLREAAHAEGFTLLPA